MAILPTHKYGITLREHCRIMVKDEKLTYLQQDKAYQKFWAIPYGNLNVLMLGTGTSITQAAARLLSEEGVMLAFVGGGGMPLFLASQSEYRPTEYFQQWCGFWWDESKRLKAAQFFQQQRCAFIKRSWKKIPALVEAGIMPDTAIDNFLEKLATAKDNQQLMGYEANFSKALYRVLAEHFGHPKCTREQGKGDPFDLFNSYLDHGNYLAYGLAASVLWVLGISHAMPVSHGLTRRGALVFDLADIIKDGAILPNAFASAAAKHSDQEMRNQCIGFLDESNALGTMFTQVKAVLEHVAA